MRVGENPAKTIQKIRQPERITVAVLSYVPFLSGYYSEALEVLKLCLDGIWRNSDLPYDLMVFDNGSCPETQDFLLTAKTRGKIQYLVLSDKNVGKGAAWNLIFQGAPGEIIAYCDGDALLYKGWLSACVKILETYPNVGMVTARPMRTDLSLSSATLAWAGTEKKVKMNEGQLINFEEFKEFADTMGYTRKKISEIYGSTRDVCLDYRGIRTFVGANHFQFVGWKKVLSRFTPFAMHKPLGQVQQLDERLNQAGHLRLMTEKPLVQNMSNRVPRQVADEVAIQRVKRSGWHHPLLKKMMLSLYDKIFKIYFES